MLCACCPVKAQNLVNSGLLEASNFRRVESGFAKVFSNLDKINFKEEIHYDLVMEVKYISSKHLQR
jgi:hypothetical protein